MKLKIIAGNRNDQVDKMRRALLDSVINPDETQRKHAKNRLFEIDQKLARRANLHEVKNSANGVNNNND